MRHLALIFIFIAGSLYAGNSAPAAKEPIIEGYRVVRCQFDKKRIVLKKNEEVIVLSEKETVPGTHVVVLRIDKKQAVLEKLTRGGKQYILIEEKDGAPVVRILKNRPTIQQAFPPSAAPVIVTQTNQAGGKN